MKKLISTFVAAVLITASLAAQESFTTKFGSIKGVTSVYVSKALLGMMPDMKSNGKNFGAVAGNHEGELFHKNSAFPFSIFLSILFENELVQVQCKLHLFHLCS